jgi:putative membrane protein
MKIALATALACLTSLFGAAADDGAKQHATDFATKAAMSNLFEIEAAKIELTKGDANDAKQFAQDMLTDHGKAGPLLSDAAKQDGVELPVVLDKERAEKLEALQNSDAANLDQAYLSTQAGNSMRQVLSSDRRSNAPGASSYNDRTPWRRETMRRKIPLTGIKRCGSPFERLRFSTLASPVEL